MNGSTKELIRSKTFWTALAGVVYAVIKAITTGDGSSIVEEVTPLLSIIFLRHAVAKNKENNKNE